MNNRQKAIRDKQPGYTMSAADWEYATDDFKHLRKSKTMKNIQFKEYSNIISEGKFSKSLIAKALKIAKKSGGQMTKAWKQIEKIKKGLGDDPAIADALKVANEEVQTEAKEAPDQYKFVDKKKIGDKVKYRTTMRKKGGRKMRVGKVTGIGFDKFGFTWYDIDRGVKTIFHQDLDEVVDVEEKIRKGREKDYIVIMVDKAGKEFKRIDYPTEKKAREAIKSGKFSGSAGMTFKLEKDGKSLKVEELEEFRQWTGFSSSQIKKAIAIAKKMGGNMTGAVKAIERIKKGLSDDDAVEDALKTANEEVVMEKADRNEVIELKLFIENDPRLYKSKLVPIVKNIQRKMKSDKYDHKKAPKLWMYLVKEGQKLYSKEFDGLKFGTDVHKQVAQELADEYRDEIEAQGGTMFESKFYLQFEEFVTEDKDLDEATGNEIKKYMKEKWSVAVKASKVGSKHMRAVGKIPNDFRKEIISKFMPKAKILNKDNINYGNIMDNMVTLRTEEWDKLLKEDHVATAADWDVLEAGLKEGKYKIDHKTFTSAVQEALKVAAKAGYEVDEDDYFHQVATGPKKPSEGKTNKYSIALTKRGKPQKKALQIQIYGKGKHGFELNCYIS